MLLRLTEIFRYIGICFDLPPLNVSQAPQSGRCLLIIYEEPCLSFLGLL